MQDHEKLIVIRKALGYNQWEDFATKLGYTNKYSYRSIETGRDPVNPNLKLKLSQIFGVSMNFLNTGTGEMFEKVMNHAPPMTDTEDKTLLLGLSTEEIIGKLLNQNDKLIGTIERNSAIIQFLSNKLMVNQSNES